MDNCKQRVFFNHTDGLVIKTDNGMISSDKTTTEVKGTFEIQADDVSALMVALSDKPLYCRRATTYYGSRFATELEFSNTPFEDVPNLEHEEKLLAKDKIIKMQDETIGEQKKMIGEMKPKIPNWLRYTLVALMAIFAIAWIFLPGSSLAIRLLNIFSCAAWGWIAWNA